MPRLRLEEGWVGIASVVWALLISIWCIATDRVVAYGKQEGDDQGQITAIEDAIARGDKGILITPMSTGVNAAIKKARDAGLYVIALDTPPDPADTAELPFTTADGQYGAAPYALDRLLAPRLHGLARGVDDRPVEAHRERFGRLMVAILGSRGGLAGQARCGGPAQV